MNPSFTQHARGPCCSCATYCPLIIAGFAILFHVPNSTRWDGRAMSVGAGLAVLLLNLLFRLGTQSDHERDAEEAARESLATHGHWPDEHISITGATLEARTEATSGTPKLSTAQTGRSAFDSDKR
jgi:hypothetical protein